MLTIDKKTKLADIKSAINCDTVSKNRAGNYIAKKEYFKRPESSSELSNQVLQKISGVKLIKECNEWVSATALRFYVEFKII